MFINDFLPKQEKNRFYFRSKVVRTFSLSNQSLFTFVSSTSRGYPLKLFLFPLSRGKIDSQVIQLLDCE